jgi:putative Ca2+/H+ antiporter (TMEM165/GDT1 family)
MLKEAYEMSPHETQEEYEEAEEEIEKKQRKSHRSSTHRNILLETFALTFFAEWGDRSQITTIVLAAKEVC